MKTIIYFLLFFQIYLIACQNRKYKQDDLNLEKYEEDKLFFIKYESVFNKSYPNNLIFKKLETFESNIRKIIKHNKGNSLYELGVTQFTDMTLEELAEKYLDMDMNLKIGLKFLNGKPDNSEEESLTYTPIDWRDKDVFLPVRDQGDCGACWAFASVGTVEALLAKKSGIKNYLSPQQLVDCDTKEKGCKGGWPSIAYNYAASNGFVLEDDYPYQAANGQCKQDIVQSLTAVKIDSNFARCEEDECTTDDAQFNMLKNGPVTVVIDAYNTNFFNYKSGIYDASCGEPNHAVMLVGYGVDSKTATKYWIIRNSWGSQWGMNGFGYVKMDVNNNYSCNLNRYGYQPKIIN
jgi:C1A family cysteine protease